MSMQDPFSSVSSRSNPAPTSSGPGLLGQLGIDPQMIMDLRNGLSGPDIGNKMAYLRQALLSIPGIREKLMELANPQGTSSQEENAPPTMMREDPGYSIAPPPAASGGGQEMSTFDRWDKNHPNRTPFTGKRRLGMTARAKRDAEQAVPDELDPVDPVIPPGLTSIPTTTPGPPPTVKVLTARADPLPLASPGSGQAPMTTAPPATQMPLPLNTETNPAVTPNSLNTGMQKRLDAGKRLPPGYGTSTAAKSKKKRGGGRFGQGGGADTFTPMNPYRADRMGGA